jgi:hypothetical protein
MVDGRSDILVLPRRCETRLSSAPAVSVDSRTAARLLLQAHVDSHLSCPDALLSTALMRRSHALSTPEILNFVSTLNRPGMSGDSTSWESWSHVRWFVEEVPAGAA